MPFDSFSLDQRALGMSMRSERATLEQVGLNSSLSGNEACLSRFLKNITDILKDLTHGKNLKKL